MDIEAPDPSREHPGNGGECQLQINKIIKPETLSQWVLSSSRLQRVLEIMCREAEPLRSLLEESPENIKGPSSYGNMHSLFFEKKTFKMFKISHLD